MSHDIETVESSIRVGRVFAFMLLLAMLGAGIWGIVGLVMGADSKQELEPEKPPAAVAECKPREFTGNVKITEHDMKVKGWEGRLWKNSDGEPLGLAVRKTEIEVGPRLKFQSMVRTDWGWCDAWSEHSPGSYCLIKSYDLRDIGVKLYKMYSDPKIYDALP